MAIHTGRFNMRSSKRKASNAVIKVACKIHWCPCIFGMTGCTIVTEPIGAVVWISGLIEIRLMTARTRIGRIRISVGMTLCTIVGN